MLSSISYNYIERAYKKTQEKDVALIWSITIGLINKIKILV